MPDPSSNNSISISPAVRRAIDEFNSLNFNHEYSLSDFIKNITSDYAKEIRPGLGLLGTRDEENRYHGEPIEGEGIKAGQEEDTLMPDAEEICSADFTEYRAPSKRVHDADDGEELGDYERESFGQDFVEMPSGKLIAIWDYLGARWDHEIDLLYAAKPMKQPPHMRMVPYDHQLQAAGYAIYSLDGNLKLFILADEMGVGKTLPAILVMWEKREIPGMSIVICPKSLCTMWEKTIANAWEEGKGLRASVIEDNKLTQAEILAGAYDVIICSYEFFEFNGKKMHKYHEGIAKARNDPTGRTRPPKRPTSALQSPIWDILGMPFKVAVFDEAQKIGKEANTRHQALRDYLPYTCAMVLSGTIAHNKWHGISGLLAFGRAHPFKTRSKFLHAFASFGENESIDQPSEERIRYLQKFLQRITISRPASILNLPNCTRSTRKFLLLKNESEVVSKLTFDYYLVAGIKDKDAPPSFQMSNAHSNGRVFGKAFKAQMASLHPILAEMALEGSDVDITDDASAEEVNAHVLDEQSGIDREEFLEKIRQRVHLIEESGRLSTVMDLYSECMKNYPGEKIAMFSNSLRFLDIVAEALRRRFGVEALRFDGTVPPHKRDAVQSEFEKCEANIPMLVTIAAGGVGLSLQFASVGIITEPQWNKNVELQAFAKLYRNAQDKEVKGYLLEAANSEYDSRVLGIQGRKVGVNAAVMKPLIRKPGEGPMRIELLNIGTFGRIVLPLPTKD